MNNLKMNETDHKLYLKPELHFYGKVIELTQGPSQGTNDSGGPTTTGAKSGGNGNNP